MAYIVRNNALEQVSPQDMTWPEWLATAGPAVERLADMGSLLRAWQNGDDPDEWRAWAKRQERHGRWAPCR